MDTLSFVLKEAIPFLAYGWVVNSLIIPYLSPRNENFYGFIVIVLAFVFSLLPTFTFGLKPALTPLVMSIFASLICFIPSEQFDAIFNFLTGHEEPKPQPKTPQPEPPKPDTEKQIEDLIRQNKR